MAGPLPPGLAGYALRADEERKEQAHQLQQAAGALSLADIIKKREERRNFQTEYAALGPNPSSDDVLKIVGKYSEPQQLLAVHMAAEQRREAQKERALQFAQNLEFKQSQLDLQRQAFQQRTEDAAARQRFEEWYKTESLKNRQQSDALNAQLRAVGLEIQKQNGQLQLQRIEQNAERALQRNVQQLGTALERANLPEADAVLRGVEDALKKNPELASYLSGPKSLLPDMTVSNDVAAGRQAFQKLFNITLKNRSGAAVTVPEFERLKQEFATGVWKTPEQLRAGVQQARQIISDHYRSVASGFGPDVMNAYNANLRQFGGTPLLEPQTAPAAPRPGQVPPPPPGFKLD